MSTPVAPPEGYEVVRAGVAWGFALPLAAPWLRETLSAPTELHAWARGRPSVRELQGRGRVFSVEAPVPGPEDRGRWVVRHYRRGGSVAPVLGDRYVALGPPRPLMEVRASVECRRRGIPTPAVVAGAVYRTGMFYRADLVTEEIPGARDLAQVLFVADPDPDTAHAALMAAGALVRALERRGVHHPDLNAKNIVLSGEARSPAAHLVDLDRCRVRAEGVPAPALPMRRRLERSLLKHERVSGLGLTADAWDALLRGFGEAA